MDAVYEKWPFYTKNSQLRLIINRMSFPAYRKSGSTEVQKLLASIPMRLVEVSQKEG
jgi:hypothetical protein